MISNLRIQYFTFVVVLWTVFLLYIHKRANDAQRLQPIYVGIAATDTFSTAKGWRIDTFISYNSFIKQLDTQYYFKRKKVN